MQRELLYLHFCPAHYLEYFQVTDWSSHCDISSTATPQDPPLPFYPGRNHMVEMCLHCRPISSEAGSSDQHRSYSAVVEKGEKRKQSLDQSAISDASSSDPQKQPLTATASQSTAFRKELLRLVSLLCVRKKYAEQGLLRYANFF